MDDRQAILLDLRCDQFIIEDSSHAEKRMLERNVTRDDIANLGFNGKVQAQKNGCYIIRGEDLDDDSLSVVVEFDGDTLLITVME